MKKNFNREEAEELLKLTPEKIMAMSFETAMEYLEKVVELLEREGTPLELGLKLYEIGNTLSKKCGNDLDQTEAKMIKLLGDKKEEEFDPEKDGR